jgi:hypothetical protein
MDEPPQDASSDCEIKAYYFTDPVAVGKIEGENIAIEYPYGTNFPIDDSFIKIFHTGVYVTPSGSWTGDAVNGYTRNYTVTSQKGTTKQYSVTATEQPPMPTDSLQAWLNWVEANAQEGGDYAFTIPADESIELNTLSYSGNNVRITLSGGSGPKTVSLLTTGSLFAIGSNVTLTLGGKVTLQGRTDNSAPLVQVNSGGNLVMEKDSKITGNTNNGSGDGGGGGVYVDGGNFTMNDGEISGNTSGYGGGVYVNDGMFTMNGGTISGNTANTRGGGVYVNGGGNFTMNGGEISGNTSGDGGGVYLIGGTFTMNDGNIRNNTVLGSGTGDGGGVHIYGGTFTMTGGTISENKASVRGGGVALESGTFTKTGNSIIYGSDAPNSLNNVALSGNGNGHAASVGLMTVSKYRDTTAGSGVNMDGSKSGSLGGWE